MIPNTLEELAEMIAKRDNITLQNALDIVEMARVDMETAFMNGSLDQAETILAEDLGLEPDYLMLFIN